MTPPRSALLGPLIAPCLSSHVGASLRGFCVRICVCDHLSFASGKPSSQSAAAEKTVAGAWRTARYRRFAKLGRLKSMQDAYPENGALPLGQTISISLTPFRGSGSFVHCRQPFPYRIIEG